MKSIVFAALLLVATATASDFERRRDVEEVVVNAVETIKNAIVNRGLDPYELANGEVEYVLIHPSFFAVSAFIQNFRFTGLSNIAIRYLDYSPATQELAFYIELPQVMATIGDAGVSLSAVGRDVQGEARGLLAINGLGAEGRVRVNYGADTTIQVIYVRGHLRSIESNLTLKLWTFDVSSFVNQWLRALPENLRIYDDLISRGLARAIEFLINRRLD